MICTNCTSKEGISNFKGKDTLSGEAAVKMFYLPTEKGSTLKGNNLLPFPIRVDTFLEGDWCAGKETRSHKNCLPCKKWQKIY